MNVVVPKGRDLQQHGINISNEETRESLLMKAVVPTERDFQHQITDVHNVKLLNERSSI